MKNHKGFVPALLTLGLVLIGSLVTIGVSYLTNTNKIASNPKAAEKTCTTGFYANKEESYPGNGDGCNAVCGTDCEECKWAGETKYQCKSAADGSEVNVPACTKARTFASLTNCKAEHPGPDGDANCKQCLLGFTNRVEYGGTGPPAGGSEKRTGKLNELCLFTETELGTDTYYYCSSGKLKCSSQNDKGRCVEDEGSAKAPREGCKQIIVKGKITSKQQNDCSIQKINGISKKVEYKDGRYWCCEGVNSDDVDIKCDDPRYCANTFEITYVKGEQSLNGNKLTQYFADNNDCSSWNNGKDNKNEICLPPADGGGGRDECSIDSCAAWSLFDDTNNVSINYPANPLSHYNGKAYLDDHCGNTLHTDFIKTDQEIIDYCNKSISDSPPVDNIGGNNLRTCVEGSFQSCIFGEGEMSGPAFCGPNKIENNVNGCNTVPSNIDCSQYIGAKNSQNYYICQALIGLNKCGSFDEKKRACQPITTSLNNQGVFESDFTSTLQKISNDCNLISLPEGGTCI